METALIILAIAVPFALLVRSKIRSDALRKLTSLDSTDSQIEANTTETGHSHTYYVTKDPRKYQQIFVPKNKD